jgi:hypothetical protein
LLTDGRNGIPEDFPTRVVREDPVREGLLYAGTEFGMFVSLDDGASWHEFQQNLGVTPVTDIRVVRDDLAISTMGRSFWVLDNVSTLRQDAFQTTNDQAVLFKPKDTIRYRNIYGRQSKPDVPDYPPPAVVVDYYLPDDISGPVRLDVLDANGALVNSYKSADDEDAEDEVVEDMNLSQTLIIVDESLSADSGMNRFRWNMSHFGAWTEDEDDRFKRGPMAKPGIYTLKLTAGGVVSEQSVKLMTDPRVLAQGTTLGDIDQQVDFELVVVDLLSEVRKFEKEVVAAHEELESRSDELTPAEASRLLLVTDVLNQVKTADLIYPQPMLTDQVSYLYNMVSGADQAPGIEAADRLAELSAKFGELRAAYQAGD